MTNRGSKTLLLAALIAAAAFLAFLPSLGFGFVWDDDALIRLNERIADLSLVPSHFLKSFWNVSEELQDISRSFYRPLIMTTFSFDHAVWILRPAGYHLTNILMHALNSIMVFFIIRSAIKSPAFSLVGALLFAIHPVHIENVCWISGRTDLLCAVFFLSATMVFCHFIRGDASPRTAIPSVLLLYICSLLSKETGVVLPAIALAAALTMRATRGNLSVTAAAAALFLIAGIYMVLRILFLAPSWVPDIGLTGPERMAAAFLALSRYLGLFFFVVRPDPHHSDALPSSAYDPAAALAALALLVYCVGIFLAHRKKRAFLAFWLAWPLITLLPVMNIGSFGDVVYADRFLYIPSVAGCVLIAYALKSIYAIPRLRIPVTASICMLLIVAIHGLGSYIPIWQSNISLFEYASRTSPSSPYIFFNLGNSYSRKGRHTEACHAYARAITLQDDYNDARLNMSASLHKLGRYSEAIAILKDAISREGEARRLAAESISKSAEREPRILENQATRRAKLQKRTSDLFLRTAHALLADSYRSTGDIPSAIANYRTSLNYGQTYAAHNNLGECLLAAGNSMPALNEFTLAAGIKETAEIFNNMGMVLMAQSRIEEANASLKRAAELTGPTTPTLTTTAIDFNLARIALLKGDTDAARHFLLRASRHAEEGGLHDSILRKIEAMLSGLSADK